MVSKQDIFPVATEAILRRDPRPRARTDEEAAAVIVAAAWADWMVENYPTTFARSILAIERDPDAELQLIRIPEWMRINWDEIFRAVNAARKWFSADRDVRRKMERDAALFRAAYPDIHAAVVAAWNAVDQMVSWTLFYETIYDAVGEFDLSGGVVGLGAFKPPAHFRTNEVDEDI